MNVTPIQALHPSKGSELSCLLLPAEPGGQQPCHPSAVAEFAVVRAMSPSAFILALVVLCGLAVGCVPLPKNSVVHYGVRGRLTDAASGLPIGKSHVSIVVDERKFDRTTNGRGEFKVVPEMHHFWTWLGGPMWMNATRASVEISLSDYAPYQSAFTVGRERAEGPAPPDQDRLDGSYIVLGDIQMKRREPNGAANWSQPIRSETNRASSPAGSHR